MCVCKILFAHVLEKCDAIWENPPHGENLTFGEV